MKTTSRLPWRPQLEALEDRQLLSVSVLLQDSGHTLKITGDDAANRVEFIQDDTLNRLTLKINGLEHNFGAPLSSSQITKMIVDLKGGNDRYNHYLERNSNFTNRKEVTLKLGSGENQADIFNLGYGVLQEFRANYSLNVTGGEQRDVVMAIFGSIQSANVSVTADLKGGNDHLLTQISRAVDGQGVATAYLGSGNDTYNAYVGDTDDSDVTYTAYLGDGDDTFSAYLIGDLVSDANVKFDIRGEGNADRFFFHGADEWHTGRVGIASDADLDVNLDGGRGNDYMSFNYRGVLDGELKLRLRGGDGSDELDAELETESASDGDLDVILYGGAGNDLLRLDLWDASSGDLDIEEALVDGGRGTDSRQVWSYPAGVIDIISCEQRV
jgi:hypothetical protein